MRATPLLAVLLLTGAAVAAGPRSLEAQGFDPGKLGLRLKSSPQFGLYEGHVSSFQVNPSLQAEVRLGPSFWLRPGIGFGRSYGGGTVLHLGAQGVFRPSLGSTWKPFALAGVAYVHGAASSSAFGIELPPPPGPSTRDTVTFQLGVGIDRPIGSRLAFFAETGLAYTPGTRYSWQGPDTGWRRRSPWDAAAPFRTSIGLALRLH